MVRMLGVGKQIGTFDVVFKVSADQVVTIRHLVVVSGWLVSSWL